MKKVLIIDGNSIAYSRMPSKSEMNNKAHNSLSSNEDIFIVKKFLKKLFRLIFVVYSGYEVIVVFDEPNKKTFRHELSKHYKTKKLNEKRQAQKNYVYEQIVVIKQYLKKMNIPYYSSINWEADDIIGMLVDKLEKSRYLTTIVSGDKDILQLISTTTRVIYSDSNKGPLDNKVIDRTNVWDISGGVWPDQVIDMKMLAGDSSDGIKGIGLIKDGKVQYWTSDEASEHIKRWGSIEEMRKNISKIKEPYQTSIKRGQEKLDLNRKLVTIVRDWRIEVDFKEHFLKKKLDYKMINEVINDVHLEHILKNRRMKEVFAEHIDKKNNH